MSGVWTKQWCCDDCDWYVTQFISDDLERASESDISIMEQLLAHRRAVHTKKKNPTKGLWSKRNSSSGAFTKIKRSGKVFKGVRREN